ncbi:MAG: hypothetical protein ACSLE0_23435 [Chitinophagaceae bacterium]
MLNINKSDIIKVVSGIIIGGLIMFFLLREEKEIVDVPIDIDFTTPQIVKETDTVYYPSPVYVKGEKEIDSTYYAEYLKLKDSILKDEAYKEAITINTYNEVIEDDTLKIDLYAKTRGKLLEYQIGYKVKPQTYHIDTTVTVAVPRKTRFFVGGQIVLPTSNIIKSTSFAPEVMMVNKKATKAYKVGYDIVNKSVIGGIYFRL